MLLKARGYKVTERGAIRKTEVMVVNDETVIDVGIIEGMMGGGGINSHCELVILIMLGE